MSDDATVRLVHGFEAGLTRVGVAKRFVYLHPDGSQVEDAADLERIARLAIPPAWEDVWVAADPSAHLQAGRHGKRSSVVYSSFSRGSDPLRSCHVT